MADKKRDYPDDDGKTIVDMNVEGMPWYVPKREKREDAPQGEPLTKEQLRAYRWAALKAALLVVLIFGLVFALFIAFCDFIWFK